MFNFCHNNNTCSCTSVSHCNQRAAAGFWNEGRCAKTFLLVKKIHRIDRLFESAAELTVCGRKIESNTLVAVKQRIEYKVITLDYN